MRTTTMVSQGLARLRAALPKGRFARAVVLLGGGNAFGQVLLLVASPLLTRLYDPAAFGLLAVYMALTATSGAVAALKLDTAIPVPKDDDTALRLAICAWIATLGVSLVLLLLVAILGPALSAALSTPQLLPLLWIVPLSTLALGTFSVARFWALRRGRFADVGRARLRQVALSIVVQVAAFPLGAAGLVLGQLANQLGGTWLLARRLVPAFGRDHWRPREVLRVASRYRRFPLVGMWSVLFHQIGLQTPPLLLAALFGPASAGLYALANRILKAPSGVMSGALSSAFLATSTRAASRSELLQQTLRMHAVLSKLLLPPAMAGAIVAPIAFAWTFGEPWRGAGELGRYLALVAYFSLVSAPMSMLFTTLERQGGEFVFQSVLLCARISGLLVGAWLESMLAAIVLYSVFGSFASLGMMVSLERVLGGSGFDILAQTLRSVLSGVMLCVPVTVAVAYAAPAPVLLLLFAITLGVHAWWQRTVLAQIR